MQNSFIKNIFIIIFVFLFPLFVYADPSQIVFTTSPQTISKNTLSEAITIQTQDGGGASPATETLDLAFTSSCDSGEFLNSSGNPATKFMSVNTSNRTFYYRDSTEGECTLTVKATGRNSSKEFTATQVIKIGETSGSLVSSQNNVSSSNSATKSGSLSSTNLPLGNSSLDVDIGKDRVTTPGNVLYFQALVKKSSNISSKIEFNWSYGDGHVGVGQNVQHTFKYPGQYVVVLNAKSGDISSVSRIKVFVDDAKISMSESDGVIDITNNSDTEINLFNWKIEKDGMGFIFQPDTIVLPKATMRFDKSLLNMRGDTSMKGVTLKNASGVLVSQIMNTDNLISSNIEYVKSIQEQKYYNQTTQNTAGVLNSKVDLATTSTSTNVLYESVPQKSVMSKMWKFVKNIFN